MNLDAYLLVTIKIMGYQVQQIVVKILALRLLENSVIIYGTDFFT